MQIIGAGLGRTGTTSLRLALEHLLDAPCYHMSDVFRNPAHVAFWHAAARNEAVDWRDFFSGCAAAVDWPAAAFWTELTALYPDALVLLSDRDTESWWRSANTTIFPAILEAEGEWRVMMDELFSSRFRCSLSNKASAIAGYERHVDRVRSEIPASRLVEWRVGDGWGPLCSALCLPVPKKPFPHLNTARDYIESRC